MRRALSIVLVCCLVAVPTAVVGEPDGKATYLVSFTPPPMDPGSGLDMARINDLRVLQNDQLARAERLLERELRPSHRYFATHSGVALELSPTEARRLAQQRGVSNIRREAKFRLAIWNSPGFIGAETVWSGAATPSAQGFRGEGMIAAVLDTGLPSTLHASFADDPSCGHGATQPAKQLSVVDCAMTDDNGWCIGPDPYDRHGHGSHVAAILAGNRIDRSALPVPPIPSGYSFMSGVAPCASIRSYKVCPTEFCPESHILAGLNQVLLDGDVDVLNFSISGGRDPWRDNDRAKLDLVAADIVVVAAAGNTGPGVANPTGAVNHLGPWVLSVAASSRDATPTGGPAQGDVLAGFSLRGPSPAPLADLQKPDLTAPGIAIRSAWPGGYELRSGTSMASPHVAGAALLLRQAHPDWTAMEVNSALRMSAETSGTAEDGKTPWHPDQVGSGRVELGRAARVGLVLDESRAAFLAARPVVGGDVRTLNLPALRDLDCSPRCGWSRLLRNALDEPSHWQVLVDADNDLAIEISPADFELGGSPDEQVMLEIRATPQVDLLDRVHFAEIRLVEQGGLSPELRMTVAVKGRSGAALVVAPDRIATHAEQGSTVNLALALSNPGSADLHWQARSVGRAVQADEGSVMLSVPPMSLAGGGATQSHIMEVDPAMPGRVTDLSFRGTVELETDSWASDLRMELISPSGDRFEVGGFNALSVPWAFQGVSSSLDDIYASHHADPFGADGTTVAGTWSLSFSNDFAGGGRMDWHDVEIVLVVDAGRCDPGDAPEWLTLEPAQGQLEPGSSLGLNAVIDAAQLALGAHHATLCLDSNAIDRAETEVPVRIDVFPAPAPDQAVVSGQVISLGACDATQLPLSGAELKTNQEDLIVHSAADGFFQLPVRADQPDLALLVGAPGHRPVSLDLPALGAGEQHVVAMTLRVDQPCAELELVPSQLSLSAGEQGQVELGVNNTGAAGLDWRVEAGAGPACERPAPDWLTGLPAAGVLGPDSNASQPLPISSVGLAPGLHTTRLCLFQDAETLPRQVLDLVLEVLPNTHTWTIDGEVSALGRCGQIQSDLPDTRVRLVDRDGRVRDVPVDESGLFRFGADTRFQPYTVDARAEGYQDAAEVNLEAEAGSELVLALALALDQPCAVAMLDETEPLLEAGQSTVLELELFNRDGLADLDWQLSFALALPEPRPDGTRPHDPSLDEVLDLPPVTLQPGSGPDGELVVQREAGQHSQGSIIGLSFHGQVQGISERPDRASDLRLQVQAPDQQTVALGGFSGLRKPWSFQGPVSASDGPYHSTHWLNAEQAPLFGAAGVADAGLWQLRLAHDWNSSQAGPMHWQDMQVTLHKLAPAGCQYPVPLPWLSVAGAGQAGVLAAGEERLVPVAVDAAILAPGQYRGLICLATSDPQASLFAFEIVLIVEPAITRVFTDRFEAVK